MRRIFLAHMKTEEAQLPLEITHLIPDADPLY